MKIKIIFLTANMHKKKKSIVTIYFFVNKKIYHKGKQKMPSLTWWSLIDAKSKD